MKRPHWMTLSLWETLQAIEPNPQVETGPSGQEVVLLMPDAAVCLYRGVQDALELMQEEA